MGVCICLSAAYAFSYVRNGRHFERIRELKESRAKYLGHWLEIIPLKISPLASLRSK